MSIRPKTMFSISSLDGSETILLPNPDTDSAKNTVTTLVNAGRSSLGIVTAQKIGRDQEKTELKWNYLERVEWEPLLRFWDNNFYFTFTYYSRVSGARISRVFYVGDRADKPFNVDEFGVPTAYEQCAANLVDTGKEV